MPTELKTSQRPTKSKKGPQAVMEQVHYDKFEVQQSQQSGFSLISSKNGGDYETVSQASLRRAAEEVALARSHDTNNQAPSGLHVLGEGGSSSRFKVGDPQYANDHDLSPDSSGPSPQYANDSELSPGHRRGQSDYAAPQESAGATYAGIDIGADDRQNFGAGSAQTPSPYAVVAEGAVQYSPKTSPTFSLYSQPAQADGGTFRPRGMSICEGFGADENC